MIFLIHLITLIDYTIFLDMSGGKRKAPPKAENLIGFHLSIIKEASERYAGHPLILAGKSMGSR